MQRQGGYPPRVTLAVALPFGVASAVVYGTSIVVQHRVASESAPRAARRAPRACSASSGTRPSCSPSAATSSGSCCRSPRSPPAPWCSSSRSSCSCCRCRCSSASGSAARVRGGRTTWAASASSVAWRSSCCSSAHPQHRARAALAPARPGRSWSCWWSAPCWRSPSPDATGIMRGAIYGAVAGMYFGALAVMVDAASERASSGGAHALFATHRGLVPLIGILVLGGGGIVLTQLSFQVGALSATLPANLAVDPVVGVVLGAMLLREHIPHSPLHIVAYLACLAAVVAGTIELATSPTGAAEGGAPSANPARPAGPWRHPGRGDGNRRLTNSTDDPGEPRQGAARGRRDVRRRRPPLRRHQHGAVLRPGPALAAPHPPVPRADARAAACSTSPPAPASRPSSWRAAACERWPATSPSACCGPAAPSGDAAGCRSWPATRCACRSPTAAFDAVTISFGLRNVVDVPAALREMARVVRPGGRLVVCEFSRPDLDAVPRRST